MIVPIASKDPSARLDYSFDWSDWLVDGDPITASTWVAPTGVTVDAHDFTAATTRAFLLGGEAGRFYTVVNRVTTQAGRIDERSLTLVVENR